MNEKTLTLITVGLSVATVFVLYKMLNNQSQGGSLSANYNPQLGTYSDELGIGSAFVTIAETV